MKRLVLTGYDHGLAEVGDLTTPGKADYADRWGYDFECVREYEAGSHPSWQKLRLLLDRLEDYDEILWLDADSLVTNPAVDVMRELSSIARPLLASRDWGNCRPKQWDTHFSMGNFIVRAAAVAVLLQAAQHTQWANAIFWEQSALQEMARERSGDFVEVLPRRALNAVPRELRPAPEPWQPGDFIAHLTSESNADRLRWIEAFSATL